jgi:hypothetical protein
MQYSQQGQQQGQYMQQMSSAQQGHFLQGQQHHSSSGTHLDHMGSGRHSLPPSHHHDHEGREFSVQCKQVEDSKYSFQLRLMENGGGCL